MPLILTQSDKFLLQHAFGTPETRDRVVALLEAAGSGDVAGPGLSIDNALPRFDGTTGVLLQSSLVTISDVGALTAPQISTPSNPVSGNNSLYFKSDNKLYKLTSAGVETEVGAAGGLGDVVGPAGATDNALVRFDTTTGKLIQNSSVTLSDGATPTLDFVSGGLIHSSTGNLALGVWPTVISTIVSTQALVADMYVMTGDGQAGDLIMGGAAPFGGRNSNITYQVDAQADGTTHNIGDASFRVGNINLRHKVTMGDIATPTTPTTDQNHLYFKAGSLYKMADDGIETPVGGAGSGDVVGPATATDNAVVVYDGTTGKLIKDSAVTITSGQLEINTVGKGLTVKGGANAKVGLHTLTGIGTDTVLNSSVTASSIIMVTPQVFGGTPVRQPMVDGIVPGVSFNLLYTAADTSTVAYFIIEVS